MAELVYWLQVYLIKRPLSVCIASNHYFTVLLILYMNMRTCDLVGEILNSDWRKVVCVVLVNSSKWYRVCMCLQCILHKHTHTHTQIQMQILEVTQRSDRVGRDLVMNGEVRVINYYLNPPTSCDPAISQTPTTGIHTINNPVWSPSGGTLPLLRFRFLVRLNVRLEEKNFAFRKTNTQLTYWI